MMDFRRPASTVFGGAALCLFWAASAAAASDEVQQPKFAPQDTWIYHEKTQRGVNVNEADVELSVVNADGDDLLVSVKKPGSSQAPRQAMFKGDWARFRGINGVETVVSRPLSFPLSVGKTWSVEYTEINPNPAHSKEQFDVPSKVIGWEDIQTPAGKFKALKIEAKGKWVADVIARTRVDSAAARASGATLMSQQNVVQGAQRAQGRIYHTVWYVPAVKRWVKSIDDTFSSDGQVTEHAESELTTFHLADTPAQ